jgi:hypothetical protein
MISSIATVASVQASPSQQLFKWIGDDELLASLHGTPAVLIRRGPLDVELVFAIPDNTSGVPID